MTSPTVQGALRRFIASSIRGLHVAELAEVVTYDARKRRASLQPSTPGEDGELRAILVEVPVIMPGGGGFGVSLPLAQGDVCAVVYLDRDHDAFLQGADVGAPVETTRTHHVADAIAFPVATLDGFESDAASATDLVIGLDDDSGTKVVLRPDGKIRIIRGGVDLLDLVDRLLAALQSATVATMLGPQTMDAPTLDELADIQFDLSNLKV